MLRKARGVLQKWGQTHTLNPYLDENVLVRTSKPPIHGPKLDFHDYQKLQPLSRPAKHTFILTEAALPPHIHNPMPEEFKDYDVTEGFDWRRSLQMEISSLMLRGLHPQEWNVPFEYMILDQRLVDFTEKGGTRLRKARLQVFIGNRNGAAGFGEAIDDNIKERTPALRRAIQNAFANLVVIDNTYRKLPYPIEVQWRHVRMYMTPSDDMLGHPALRRMAAMIGLNKIIFKTYPSYPYIGLEAAAKTFLYALQKFHRSPLEIAAARGLTAIGHNRYLEDVRAHKGMYTTSPVSDRQSPEDRWKWNLQRSHVMQYPDRDMLREVLYKGVSLASDLGRPLGVQPQPSGLRGAPEEVKKKASLADSGREVNQYWETHEKQYRELTIRMAEQTKKTRANREKLRRERLSARTKLQSKAQSSGAQEFTPEDEEKLRVDLDQELQEKVEDDAPPPPSPPPSSNTTEPTS
eukprot:RCo005978